MDLDQDGDDDCFQLTIKDRRLPNTAVRQMKYYAKPVFDLYDSTERINPFIFNKSQEKSWKEKIAKLPLKEAEKIIDKHQKLSPRFVA